MRLVTSLSRLRMTHLMVILALLLMALPMATPVAASSTTVVISQVYGGGGNSGAPYQNDFVELHNISHAPVSLSGMSVQYASASGSGNFGANSGQMTLVSGTLAPGQYYLVQLAGGSNGVALPAADATGTISMSGSAGKVALVNSTISLGCNGSSTPCSDAQKALIVDLVGYGNANFFEGSAAAPTTTNTTSVSRTVYGCTDTDNNATDFTAGAPVPHNTASTALDCTMPILGVADFSANEGNNGTTTFTFDVSLTQPAGAGGVIFDIATADGTATAGTDYVAQALTGQTIPEGASTYKFAVQVNGDLAYENDETFFVNVSNVTGASAGDPQGQGTIRNDDVNCDIPYTSVSAIQGSGETSPMKGQTVTTQGVVVGDYEGPSPALRGFFIEDLKPDADPATSDGVFIYEGNNQNTVNLGDVVRVTGTAGENQGQTQVSATSIAQCGVTATVEPVDVTLPFPSADYAERYEGMLVRLPQTLSVTEIYQLGRFDEVLLSSGGRLKQPTNVKTPGAEANALQAANNLNQILVDDATINQNPDPILFGDNGQPLSAINTLRGGDTVTGLVGMMTYTWGGNATASPNAYRVRSVNAMGGGVPDFQPSNPRPVAAPEVGGTLRVAGMNLLNFFNTFSGCTNGVGGANTDCRGANSQAEFDRQWPKTVQAIIGTGADVIGINEVENDGYGPDSAIQFLVDRLNEATAPGTYAFINVDANTGQVNALGTDAIKVGMLYKTAKVSPVGQTAALNSVEFVNGGDGAPRSRPSLAQAFEQKVDGARFIVDLNHLKSKGSACDVPDALDGQGNCNQERLNAVKALMSWLASDPTGTGDPDVLMLGDYNSYAMEDPITYIKSQGYTNLIESFLGDEAYSYVFDGQWGYLDHALGSASITGQVTGVGDWHINSDEPSVMDYNTEFKTPNLQSSLYAPNQFRVSDHDPVVVGLKLNAPAVSTPVVTPEPSVENAAVTASADFTSTYTGYDPFTCTVDYGDGSGVQDGVVSGMTCNGPEHTYTTYGQYTVSVTVKDKEGAWATSSTVHTVIFDYHGFFGSVENPPEVNKVNSGKSVPIIFTLGGDKGMDIFSASPTMTDCQSGTTSAASGSLSYDPTDQTYTFTWKTSKNWPAGTCRQVQFTLVDGTTHQADFSFVK